MTSSALLEWLRDEVMRLKRDGRDALVGRLLGLEHFNRSQEFAPYVEGLRQLRIDVRATEDGRLLSLVEYLLGRVLAFGMDSPEESLEPLADVLGRMKEVGLQDSPFPRLVELELLRAHHKIDAPGYCDVLVRGMESLWDRFEGDAGPRFELLDVWWRTGFWSQNAAVMDRAFQLAVGEGDVVMGPMAFWRARRFALDGDHAASVDALTELRRPPDQDDQGRIVWDLYVEVALVLELVESERIDEAQEVLDGILQRTASTDDPMLDWDLARARARVADARAEFDEAVAGWRDALDVVRPRGLARLRAEFALSLGESARRAEDDAALTEARDDLASFWSTLRSRASLDGRKQALGV